MFINGIADLGLRFLGALEQGDGVNGAGHVVKMEDESGYARYSYDAMGNVSENCRTFVLPAEDNAYTFIMNTEYDTWGRTLSITYPDKELVSYAYDFGGNLKSVSSTKNSIHKSLVDSIRYDKFGDRVAVYFGNGTSQTYTYNPLSRRLGNLQGRTSTNALMQNITYDYDGVGNVTEVDNVATAIGTLGGPYTCTYTYDALNRLATTECQQGNRGYTEQRTYHNDGRIATYNLNGTRRGYSYNATQPHTLKNIYTLPNRPSDVLFSFSWDTKGNMTAQNSQGGSRRNLVWDERNRLLGVVDNATNGSAAHYVYDAQGERTFKLTGYSNSTGNKNIKDTRETYVSLDNPTLYASPYLTATAAGYTKHYFTGTERLASAIGNGGLADISTHVVGSDVLVRKHRERDTVLYHVMEPYPLRISCCGLATLYNMTQPDVTAEPIYFFHPDHLGSASWITDLNGQPVQHLQYKPFGGDYIDQQAPNTDYSERFRFTGKERDTETGYDYFGARYYSSSLGIWLSVDPMSDKYPSLSPYVYCADNPMRLVDAKGESIQVVENDDGTYTVVNGNVYDGDNGVYLQNPNGSNGILLAYSATPESFYNSETGEFMGTIDPNNQAGRDFLNNEILKSGLLSYMINALPEKKYDFKRTNGTNNVLFSKNEEFYRGMPIGMENGLPIWASARDIGNIAAGYMAGSNGISWEASRLAFDALESLKMKKVSVELSSTQYAQKLGYLIGSTIYHNNMVNQISRLPSYGDYKKDNIKPVPNTIIRHF